MRIIWKDTDHSFGKIYRNIRYRKINISGTYKGWTTDIPGDNNLYRSEYCAKNAVDKYYGDFGEHGSKRRIHFGIKIIGQKE